MRGLSEKNCEVIEQTDSDDIGISKSQAKREDALLQNLGARLVKLSKQQIADLPVSEYLHDALLEFKRIRSREAQRRHIKRVGRLIRDHDVEQVTLALDRVDPSSSLSMQATRTAQRWCDRLLQEDSSAVTSLVEHYPQLPLQSLRQLLRKAQKELAARAEDDATVTPSQRALLKLLRQHIVQHGD